MAHYLGELTESNMKNLQALIDSNSVIGREIVTPDGTVILPVSKVSFGFGSGGGDLPSSQKELFGGGTGGGVTITPLGVSHCEKRGCEAAAGAELQQYRRPRGGHGARCGG